MKEVILNIMEKVFNLGVRLKILCDVGINWYELK